MRSCCGYVAITAYYYYYYYHYHYYYYYYWLVALSIGEVIWGAIVTLGERGPTGIY